MNGELNHIKEFLQKHLEPCYYETAEEMMLVNPLCGVIQKFMDENKIEEDRLRDEKLLIEFDKNELQKKVERIEKREMAIKELFQRKIEKKEWGGYYGKLDEIKSVICGYFEVNIDQKTRLRHYVYARQIAFYYARKITKMSLAEIGYRIGKKDHATVLHSIRVIENLKRYNATKNHISELNKIFNIKD